MGDGYRRVGRTGTKLIVSTLYATESGRQIPRLGEELTARRRARKELTLPATRGEAQLYVLAASHRENTLPLRLAINGQEQPSISPDGASYRWYTTCLMASQLVDGPNRFEFWTDSHAMDAWSLAVEYGDPTSRSWISIDTGDTWHRDRIGHLYVASGEYVVRVRLEEGRDPAPPDVIPAAAGQPDLDEIRTLVPVEALGPRDVTDRVRVLATWTASAWRYRNERQGEQYAPWDPLTILAWGRDDLGHDDRLPIVMCMHYAVVFVSACAAVGISARPVVLADDANGLDGHFAAEVWLPDLQRWIYVDPNHDAMFYADGHPMSVSEIRSAGVDLAGLVAWGPGHPLQSRSPRMRRWIRDVFLSGLCFRHRGAWPYADFTVHPDRLPAAHGAAGYSELDFVWETRDLTNGFGMFRYFADDDWFDASPTPDGART
jgi:hypothetical protein